MSRRARRGHVATPSSPYGVDANGLLTETTFVGGAPVVIHYGDYPPTDITTVRGIRCTTPLRTVIDVAMDVPPEHLVEMIADCLERALFTLDDADRRLEQPDTSTHRGAARVRQALPGLR